MTRAHLRTRLWSRGLPQYSLGHGARKEVLDTTPDRVPGLYLVGNYLNGVSVTSCLEHAGKTAAAVAAYQGAQDGVGYTSSSSTNRAFS
jgi:protoporphyrinogen oxidase